MSKKYSESDNPDLVERIMAALGSDFRCRKITLSLFVQIQPLRKIMLQSRTHLKRLNEDNQF